MKKYRTKISTIALTAALLLHTGTVCGAMTAAYADDAVDWDAACWVSRCDGKPDSDGNPPGRLERYRGDYSSKLDIPYEIDGYHITGIGAYVFTDCDDVREIVIPEGVDTIERYAFPFLDTAGNLNITVTIPASVTYIGENLLGEQTRLSKLGSLLAGSSELIYDILPQYEYEAQHYIRTKDARGLEFFQPAFLDAYRSFDWERFYTSQNGEMFDKSGKPMTLADLGVTFADGTGSEKRNTIRGYDGTIAEQYAKEYNMNFVSLGKAPVSLTGSAFSNGMIAIASGIALVIGIAIGFCIGKKGKKEQPQS